MICRILLLIILNSCLCATFVVNVTQSCYQAEENHNITLEWTFTTKSTSSASSLFIFCELINDQKHSVIFYVFMGVEASVYIDTEFIGRVQSDKDVLREGQIRLHVSRLRTEDSGLYKCQVNTEYGQGSASLQLNITEAPAELQTERPTVRPEPEGGVSTFYPAVIVAVMLGAVVLVVICGVFHVVRKRRQMRPIETQNYKSLILQETKTLHLPA
ncbi:uncharacterized protein LOC124880873 isoform X2 [Girardinichthys multiradiatus]|uniref:uncharacterized protein LOC124880873 isoform X2 n=1 Tax=Girardinichthys multiradiatus TaxID=208333 RepID=UPI001FAD6BB0|nr:uncharacterized protein LOC124880873 isoform X2 [Girardinichthys multiradiatus]XP_047242235.1 uncharacterized protein LOC124880873 isoform X2 [Girardinichthys multiradiatus]